MGINITGLGAANGIGFKSKVSGGRYLPPDLKARLVSVTSCYGKKNTDSDKDILKDKTGQGNDLIVYNGTFDNIKDGYDAPFFSFMNLALTVDIKFVTYIDEVTFKSIGPDINRVILYTNPAKYKKRIPSFIINVNCSKTCRYYYIDKNKPNVRTAFNLQQGVNAVPESYADLYSGTEDEGAVNTIGFALDAGATLEVKQLSRYTGGLLTSGINGVGTFVESVKPFKEMVGDSQSVSIVSMISILEPISISYEITINNVRAITNELYGRNVFKGAEIDKTYIIGYYANLPSSTNSIDMINHILGDDKDWTYQSGGNIVDTAKLSIQGFRGTSGMPYAMVRSVIYWNIVLKGKATTDEINQVIEYYNLDRPGVIVKPDILYDIKRQGITNDNHAEFSDKLKDFIYGFDMQMYNMLWDRQSGIGNYSVSFKDYLYVPSRAIVEVNKGSFVVISNNSNGNFLEINTKLKFLPAYKVKIEGINTIVKGNLYFKAVTIDGKISYIRIPNDGEYEIPESPLTETANYIGWCILNGYNDNINVKVTLLATDNITDALTLNGIDNFGKVTNIPIWKDYTVASLRKWLFTDSSIQTGSIVSKSIEGKDGAFILEQTFNLNPPRTSTWTFGQVTSLIENPKLNEKSIASQTKYEYDYNGKNLSLGSGLDTSRMWLGVIRDGDPRFSYISIWSAMLFRYTMSKFLLERQFKKYKIGSFYEKRMVIWRPEVTSNNSNYVFTPRIRMFDGTIKALVNGEYYDPTDANLVMDITITGVNEVTDLTINKQSYKPVQYPTYWRVEISFPTKSPQRISITIEEYVRYESIVQPYPVMFKLVDKDTNKEYTYGDKVKVGSTIKVNSIIYNYQTLWSIHGYLISGDPKTYSYSEIISKDIVVTKTLSFACNKKWLLSTAEPLFVYDPSIINNIGLKNLGYLPDISGQGRHLSLYNFSYEGMSGKDGYPVVFGANKTWAVLRSESDVVKYGLSSTKITVYKSNRNAALCYSYVYNAGSTNKITIPSFKLKITGLTKGQTVQYRYISESDKTRSSIIELTNGTHDIPKSYPIEPNENTSDGTWIGILINSTDNDYNLTLEILPDYKDSLCFDGVIDYGTVQNLTYGGKCLVSKLNIANDGNIVYDQRKDPVDIHAFCLYTDYNKIAFNHRNTDGDTYINNILNSYIVGYQVLEKDTVVTMTNPIVTNDNTGMPVFGKSRQDLKFYSQFAMYRTILLPEIPSDEDRTILNDWCGIPTGQILKPKYYWDAYGKTNTDTDRGFIKDQVSLQLNNDNTNNNSLENFNFGYEGMSGYNGYPVVFGANKTWTNIVTNDGTIWNYELTPTSIVIYKSEPTGTFLIRTWVISNGVINSVTVPEFKIKISNLKDGEIVQYHYISNDNNSIVSSVSLKTNGIHTLPASVPIVTEDLSTNKSIGFTFKLNDNANADGLIIEIQPNYPNGFALDGIDDYSNCANVPAFTDYSYIFVREILSNDNANSVTMHKGIVKPFAGAFTSDYVIKDAGNENNFAFHSFGSVNILNRNKVIDKVLYATTTSVNGTTTNRGSNTDDPGITIGKFENNYRQMIFYKLLLWDKTINGYSINMIRNLINNNDGIIDLSNPLFDQSPLDEGGGDITPTNKFVFADYHDYNFNNVEVENVNEEGTTIAVTPKYANESLTLLCAIWLNIENVGGTLLNFKFKLHGLNPGESVVFTGDFMDHLMANQNDVEYTIEVVSNLNIGILAKTIHSITIESISYETN